MGYMKALATEMRAALRELFAYLEQERQRGLKIHSEMEKLIMEGKAKTQEADDWLYYEGYADGMAGAINKLAEKFPPEQ